MKKILSAVLCLALAFTACATQYSKLSLMTAAKQSGRWDGMKAWIQSADLWDEWTACSYLSDDYPQFVAITNAIVQSGKASTAEIEAILAASLDTAVPDEAMNRMYANAMSNANERVKWHGAIVTNRVDTNALVKVQVYADGFTWTQHFKSVRAMGLEDRLTAAEKKARQEAARKRAAELAAKRKADRIADLQTNMVVLATAMARQKQYPVELATMLLQVELNKLIGTNTVDAVITPAK